MPTSVPDPIVPSKDVHELIQRKKAMYTIITYLNCLHGWAYATRSFMPTGVDHTEFISCLSEVKKFITSRPDWNNEMLERSFTKALLISDESIDKELTDQNIIVT